VHELLMVKLLFPLVSVLGLVSGARAQA